MKDAVLPSVDATTLGVAEPVNPGGEHLRPLMVEATAMGTAQDSVCLDGVIQAARHDLMNSILDKIHLIVRDEATCETVQEIIQELNLLALLL